MNFLCGGNGGGSRSVWRCGFFFCKPLNCDPVELEGVWRFDSDLSKRTLLSFGIVLLILAALRAIG